MKIRTLICVLSATVLGLLLLGGCSRAEGGLECNYSEVDITTTPEEHTVLAGFAARNGLSEGVHHRLYSHCLALRDGKQKVCIISNDLMELSPDLSLEIRKEISSRSGLPLSNILLHCIHTHSAPRFGGSAGEPGGSNYSYRQRTVEAIISNAVATLGGEFKPFKMELAKAETTIAANRCESDGPVDRTVYAARLSDLKGHPIVSILNLACHPVCMGPWSYAVSSDYFGVAADALSQSWGGPIMQLSGAQGNLDPALGPRDSLYAKQCGASLAASLLKAEFEPFQLDGTLKLVTNVAHLPYRISKVTPEAVRHHADSLSGASTDFPRFARDVRDWEEEILQGLDRGEECNSLDFSMEALNVGGAIFFFTQGEPFCEYQSTLREDNPSKTIFFAGYTNGQNSYLPSKRAYEVRKGYEYEIEQMHVYIRAPYPLSSRAAGEYSKALQSTIDACWAPESKYSIVPLPQKLEPKEGFFFLKGKLGIEADGEFQMVAEDFAQQLLAVSGKRLSKGGDIEIRRTDGLGKEAYILDVSPRKVLIEASSLEGAFYGMQTFKQLLPPEIFGSSKASGIDWKAACCHIEDAPNFAYRGLLLDCGRYFYPKEDVMKFIDQMSRVKLNMLQWHLTEDQGWRIEIKKYPLLTEVGAYRRETCPNKEGIDGDGTPHGGFYTQEDVREIVEYARHRCVNIIPEIELPGHSGAAIASYPIFSCTPSEPKEVVTSWGVKEDVFCPRTETVEFLEDVFTELFDLFPCEYYNIGGDECPKTAWQNSAYCKEFAAREGLGSVDDIQDWFVAHFTKFLSDHGKKVIGWDEILDGPSAADCIAVSYRGHAPARNAISRGIDCILAPNRWAYLDNPQEELANNGDYDIFMPLSKVYGYYPEVSELAELSSKHIIGFQGCMWGEYAPTWTTVERQVWPRAAAIAEDAWTLRERKNWDDFRLRMVGEQQRFRDTEYCKAFDNVIFRFDNRTPYPRKVNMTLDYPYATVRYTLDGSEPTTESPVAVSPIEVSLGQEVRARGFDFEGRPIGITAVKVF